jgi:hypothetical protein
VFFSDLFVYFSLYLIVSFSHTVGNDEGTKRPGAGEKPGANPSSSTIGQQGMFECFSFFYCILFIVNAFSLIY